MRTLVFAEQALLATDSVQLVSNSVRDELSKRPFESEQSLALRHNKSIKTHINSMLYDFYHLNNNVVPTLVPD
jgi:hypothetical protein